MRRRAVFLDRDGVVNRAIVRDGKPYPPASLAELELAPEAPVALGRLRAAGFDLIVATNQPDIARGKQAAGLADAIHRWLSERLPVDEWAVCPHDDADACGCRKPKPGLLVDAARRRGIELSRSYMIGDRWRDVEAGYAAGCATVWIDRGYAERGPSRPANARVRTLVEAVDWILKRETIVDDVTMPDQLKVKLFADGADKSAMLALYANPRIQGFTTNPTLMRKAGISDYESFARDIVEAIPDRPISLEVFADDFLEMERQARKIATWGESVYVKIPVMNTRREPAYDLIRRLSKEGVKLNVTALMTLTQVRDVSAALGGDAPSYVSVFAGRIADTGRDPVPVMAAAAAMVSAYPDMELIWASPRELLNVFQADAVGCHIITATPDILKKLELVNKNLLDYSQETVQMFYDDAAKSGFSL